MMKRKIIKAARKIQKMCDKITCDGCDFVSEIGWCIFTKNSPSVWELPPFPKKKFMYVKSIEEIMKLAHEKGAQIDISGSLYFKELDYYFIPQMFDYCGKKPGHEFKWHPEFLEERKE